MKWIFVAAFLLSGVYHGVGLINPALTEPATPIRHVVFLVISLIAAGILVKAKGRALYLLIPLILQQVYSHLTYGQEVWMNEKRFDWASLIVVVGMPMLGVYIVKMNQKRLVSERK
jgi:hypothetical protein